ncbi:MAG: GNAT family N-acetyltransferase, partial [Wenzhouxiangellaceae bacterium]|nr:GNAT family N-acetyltransferase [Wenzhouxiangellaceae bacterium]
MRNDSSTSPDTGRAGAIGSVDPARWNALNRDGNPFVDHRFLAALTETGAIGPHTGWDEALVALDDDPGGYAPAWIKYNSHGEFVFDFVWADAAHRAGLRWFPKLLVASPLTPVTGPRLLGESKAAREALVERLEQRVNDEGLSCCSVNFCDAPDSEVLEKAGWLGRHDWQFHWPNRGYRDFDDFLAALRSKPRKNIRRERRLARQDGWRYRWVDGESMTESELELVVHCYQDTFRLYGNLPLLNAEFFRLAARRFGTRFLACIASQHGRDLACSVFWRNAARLYGRYWGALVETRDVHF